MEAREFYIIYLKALEEALANDHINYGFLVKAPDFYIEEEYLILAENFIDGRTEGVDFLDRVGYYFDAVSHNFPSINNIPIEKYRQSILSQMQEIKAIYNIL